MRKVKTSGFASVFNTSLGTLQMLMNGKSCLIPLLMNRSNLKVISISHHPLAWPVPFHSLIITNTCALFIFVVFKCQFKNSNASVRTVHKLIANSNCMIKQAKKMPFESFEETNQLGHLHWHYALSGWLWDKLSL